MRKLVLSLSAALAWPMALSWPMAAGAQSLEIKDWQVVCDNTRSCRAAGYSVEGSTSPVSVLLTRAPSPGGPMLAELQLGVMVDGPGAHPASVALVIDGKAAGAIRLSGNNHAVLARPVLAAILKSLAGGGDLAFTAAKTTWRVSGSGAVEALQQMDDVQGRTGRPSALVRKGGGNDADVSSPMAAPRMEATHISTIPQPGDAALAVRVMASVRSNPACPLLDDGDAQGKARLWHLDANRLLVTQSCTPGIGGPAVGYWIANLLPPYDAKPLTYRGADYDGTGTLSARSVAGAAGDCGSAESWTWKGFRFEQTYAASFGLCRGVKAGGASELPSLVTELIPAN